MARAKQTPPKAPAPSSAKASAKPARAPRAAKEPTSSRSEVEKEWEQYWQHRAALEEACADVRRAQSSLAEATKRESERRIAFEEAKRSLKQLLEVESPSIELSSETPSSNVVDFDKPEP
jgi:hypothetical protein